jgi:hypothetical protein
MDAAAFHIRIVGPESVTTVAEQAVDGITAMLLPDDIEVSETVQRVQDGDGARHPLLWAWASSARTSPSIRVWVGAGAVTVVELVVAGIDRITAGIGP